MSEKYAWEGKDLDKDAARELHIYIDSDADLYRQQRTPIHKNLVAKKVRGVYDSQLAVKLFMYLVEAGAKKYTKEYSSPGDKWYEMFPKDLREAVATELRDSFEVEYDLGNYDNYIPKKYQVKKKPAKRRKAKRGSSVSVGLMGMR